MRVWELDTTSEVSSDCPRGLLPFFLFIFVCLFSAWNVGTGRTFKTRRQLPVLRKAFSHFLGLVSHRYFLGQSFGSTNGKMSWLTPLFRGDEETEHRAGGIWGNQNGHYLVTNDSHPPRPFSSAGTFSFDTDPYHIRISRQTGLQKRNHSSYNIPIQFWN
jgi:hypothetical protein